MTRGRNGQLALRRRPLPGVEPAPPHRILAPQVQLGGRPAGVRYHRAKAAVELRPSRLRRQVEIGIADVPSHRLDRPSLSGGRQTKRRDDGCCECNNFHNYLHGLAGNIRPADNPVIHPRRPGRLTTMLRNRSAFLQNGSVDWNDLRYFLAVAGTGSTLAAGRALGVSQTTAARRIAALEAALGVTLFERRPAGYRLTPAGEGLLDRARTVEQAANAVTDAAAAQTRDVSGTVRLTTDDIFAVTVLPPILGALHDAYPGIRIELDSTSEMRDLAGGAADIALRRTKTLDGNGLVARRIVSDVWRTYCSRHYAAAHGRPTTRSALRGHTLIGGGGAGVARMYGAWLKDNGLEDAVAVHYTSITGLLAAVRAGAGVTVLPCFVADLDEDLIGCLPAAGNYGGSLWLVTHERLRSTPRVRVVLDFLAEQLVQLARQGGRRAAAEGQAAMTKRLPT